MTDIRSRAWCFTLNNYTDDMIEMVNAVSSISTYLIYGKEIAPNTGTPHLQGYIYFQNAKTFLKMKKLMPEGTHLEVAKGDPTDNKKYCSKEGDYKEFGTIPSQGKRNDIKVIKDEINAGRGMREIVETASNYQTLRTAELLLKYVERKRDWKPMVIWLYGESGCGKTKTAYEKTTDPYRKSNSTGKWWDGYDAHEDVILDDIKDTSREMYSQLLELLDRYSCRVEVKGGTRQFLAKKIIVTSIKSPYELYSQYDDAVELLRRIDDVICLSF